MTAKNNQEYVSTLKGVLSELVSYMDELVRSFPQKISKQMYAIPATYLTMFELAEAIRLLYFNGRLNQIAILLRSFVDSLYDLKLLKRNPDSIEYMYAKDISADIRVFKTILNPRNGHPAATDPERRKQVLENLRTSEQNLEALKRRGITPKRNVDKFQELGAMDLHGTVFDAWNREAHNSIGVLIRRHIVFRGNSGISYKYLESFSRESYSHTFFQVAMAILDAVAIVRKTLNIEFREQLTEMIAKIAATTGKDLSQFNWYDYEENAPNATV